MDAEAELAKEEIEHTATMQRIAQQVLFNIDNNFTDSFGQANALKNR